MPPSRAQLRKFRNLAGQMGQDGALNKLAQIKPLLLAIMDAVLALKCEEEMVKPKQDRDFARGNECRCMPTGGLCGEP